MYCAICQTTPCQHLPGPLTQEAAWLFSDEAEQTLTSGAWSSLFEHLAAQVQEPDFLRGQKNNRSQPPSQETTTYWIRAHGPQESLRESVGDRSGKWLVFVPANQVDRVWSRIKTAVEEGQLGGSAKVATAKKSPLQEDPNERVICVYTSDWTDEYDVRRIHAELFALGCTWPMSYKTD